MRARPPDSSSSCDGAGGVRFFANLKPFYHMELQSEALRPWMLLLARVLIDLKHIL